MITFLTLIVGAAVVGWFLVDVLDWLLDWFDNRR